MSNQTPFVRAASALPPASAVLLDREVEAPRKLGFDASNLTERQQIAYAMRQSSARPTPQGGVALTERQQKQLLASGVTAASGEVAATLIITAATASEKPQTPFAARIDVVAAEAASAAAAAPAAAVADEERADGQHTIENEGVFYGNLRNGKRNGEGRMDWCVARSRVPLLTSARRARTSYSRAARTPPPTHSRALDLCLASGRAASSRARSTSGSGATMRCTAKGGCARRTGMFTRAISARTCCTVSVLLFTVTFHANRAHNLTRSP